MAPDRDCMVNDQLVPSQMIGSVLEYDLAREAWFYYEVKRYLYSACHAVSFGLLGVNKTKIYSEKLETPIQEVYFRFVQLRISFKDQKLMNLKSNIQVPLKKFTFGSKVFLPVYTGC